MSERKRGALSLSDEAYIREHCLKKSPEEIAIALNRNAAPIIKYIDKNELIPSSVNSTIGERREFRDRLQRQAFWQQIKDLLSVEEQDFFIEYWIDMIGQFEDDVVPTEQIQMKDVLLIEILQSRLQRSLKINEDDKIFWMKKRSDEEKKPIEEQRFDIIREASDRIMGLEGAKAQMERQFNEYLVQKQKLYVALKATREQRIKEINTAKENWSGYLRYLDDENARQREGREMELMRMAVSKARKKLSENHVYGDGKVGRPVLNADTVGDEDEEESQEQLGTN